MYSGWCGILAPRGETLATFEASDKVHYAEADTAWTTDWYLESRDGYVFLEDSSATYKSTIHVYRCHDELILDAAYVDGPMKLYARIR